MDHQNYVYPDDLLRGRVILITGATAGIGRALAVHAAEHGAQVILHGRDVKKLEELYDEIEALDGAPRPSIAVMDLATADDNAYRTLAESLTEEFGRLDGLVNNASMLGFTVDHFADQFSDWEGKLAAWISEGKLTLPEHIVEGVDNFPKAVVMLMSGGHMGKLLLAP